MEVVKTICTLQDELRPQQIPCESLITYVEDRPGHDRRHAINSSKLQHELGRIPKETFKSGMRKTFLWYLNNREWLEQVTSKASKNWITANYECREARCGA